MLGLHSFVGSITIQFFRRAVYSSTARGAVVAASAPIAGTESNKAADAIAKKPKNAMIAAAFESLKDTSISTDVEKKLKTEVGVTNNKEVDDRISKAKTVNGLLSISEVSVSISRQHALKIVSILAEWSSLNRIQLSEFENDSRFLRICRVLGRTVPKNGPSSGNANGNEKNRISGFRTDDLNTVLGVAGDDEAAKLIASISLPQMVKVMSTLAQRKRRSTPLLRSLAFNVSSSTEILDLKQCADILYAMATLNFQDSVLAAKVCVDIQSGLPKNLEKSAVVGSILTSLGILKYRDLDILESLTQWVLKNTDICRSQDVSALFLTSSALNFKSANIADVRTKLVGSIVKEDFKKIVDWLNHVWALSMLGLADNQQLETVLCKEFVTQLEADKYNMSPTSKMKLLNLNSFAKLLANNYKGPFLEPDSIVFDVPIAHAKSKQIMLNGLLDALKSLLPTSNHVQSLVDSRMGFLIDAHCIFDGKRNPLPLDKEHPNGIKVALMVVDFHDVCHGPHRSVSGITNMTFDLLEKNGYQVLPVPYHEFSTSDKLLKRVQYLEAKFKTIISSKK